MPRRIDREKNQAESRPDIQQHPHRGRDMLHGMGVGNDRWLALVAGLVVALKAYWLELWMRSRRASRTSKIL